MKVKSHKWLAPGLLSGQLTFDKSMFTSIIQNVNDVEAAYFKLNPEHTSKDSFYDSFSKDKNFSLIEELSNAVEFHPIINKFVYSLVELYEKSLKGSYLVDSGPYHFMHYNIGGSYDWHIDAPIITRLDKDLRCLVNLLVYLNNDYDGGNLQFHQY